MNTTLHGRQYELQTVLVPKDRFTLPNAIKWVGLNGYKIKKVDETRNFYRFRQTEPLSDVKYFSKVLPNGVELVFQYM